MFMIAFFGGYEYHVGEFMHFLLSSIRDQCLIQCDRLTTRLVIRSVLLCMSKEHAAYLGIPQWLIAYLHVI